jgi:sugar lactone lactonase YvrE
MNKFTILLVLLVFSLGSIVLAQEDQWIFDEVFYDFELPQDNGWGVHGVAVAPDGNIWLSLHGNLAQDTLFGVTRDTMVIRPMYILDPNTAAHASFSPLRIIDFGGGEQDTLWTGHATNGSGKGISIAIDGNILATSWSTVYKIDYTNGAGIAKFVPSDLASMTEAVQADDGKIFVGWVSGTERPVLILDENLTLLGNAIDTLGHLTRTFAVSPDGKDLYTGSTWNGFGIEHWHSDLPGVLKYTVVDTFGNFGDVVVERPPLPDTTYLDVKQWASCLDWDPNGNLLSGNLRDDWSGPGGKGSQWYAYDVSTYEEVYTVGYPYPTAASAGGVYSPRGAAWSADGQTMYLADFDYNNVTKWTRNPAAIEVDGEVIARTFDLSQNYPNPFNPVTTIPFAIYKKAHVELKVYDVQGKLVDTIVDGPMNAGSHNIKYDANHLATGNYFYQLKVEGHILTKKMILVR